MKYRVVINLLAIALHIICPALAWSSAVDGKIPHENLVAYVYDNNGSVKAVIKGLRYFNPETGKPNKKGKKILLTHGLMSTPHEFDHMVDYILLGEQHRSPLSKLIKEGFDIYAFTFRGHGTGAEDDIRSKRSYVPKFAYQNGDYSFDSEMQDFEAMIELINDTTESEGVVRDAEARKISVIGHSMGGMISTATTALNPSLRDSIKILVNIQSPNDFVSGYDDAEMGIITPAMGERVYNLIEKSKAAYPFGAPSGSVLASGINILQKILFTSSMEKIANLSPVGRKLVDMAKFGSKSGSSVHRDLLLTILGYAVKNNYPYVGLNPGVPVVNLYGGKDRIAPKNSIIEQSKAIYQKGGQVWTLEVETAGHLDVVFPSHLQAYMPYILTALKDPNLLGDNGSHLTVVPHQHYIPLIVDCVNILER